MVQGCDGGLVDTGIEGQAHQDTDKFRNEEGPPDIVDTAGLCQQPRCRQQHEQLAADRNDEAEDAVAQRLKDRAEHDADARQQEMQADDAHGRDTDGQHGVAGGKDAQHLPGCELEDAEACQHDTFGVAHRQLDGLFHTVRSAGTIVVADDGHHAVVQAENGHKHKALQLEVDAEHRHRRSGEGHQDQVHAKGHQAAHTLHGDAGQTHGVDAANGLGAGTEAFEADLDVRVFAGVEVQRHACAAELTDDRCHRCAGGAGQCLAAVAEDEDGIQNDVHHGTHQLADHAQIGAPGSRQQLFAHGLSEQTQTKDAAHRQILDALLRDDGVTGLGVEVGLHAGKADDKKHRKAAQGKKDAVFCGGVGAALVLFAKALAQQGVHAHTGAHAHGDHDILQ